jgi:hypothetical protein
VTWLVGDVLPEACAGNPDQRDGDDDAFHNRQLIYPPFSVL